MGYYSTVEGGITFDLGMYVSSAGVTASSIESQANSIKRAVGADTLTDEHEAAIKGLKRKLEEIAPYISYDGLTDRKGVGVVSFYDEESKHYTLDDDIKGVVDLLGSSVINVDISYQGEDYEDREWFVYQDGKVMRGVARVTIDYDFEPLTEVS